MKTEVEPVMGTSLYLMAMRDWFGNGRLIPETNGMEIES